MGCTTSRRATSTTTTTTQTTNISKKLDHQTTETGSADHNASISPTFALGAGCYWGTEKFIVKDFQKRFPKSIANAKVGFMSINPNNPLKNPNYKQVCRGNSGYIEVLNVKLNNPTPELFEELIRFFFTFHDPTTRDRQGNDWGSQYGSVIFCSDAEQAQIALNVKQQLQTLITEKKIKAFSQKEISTGIVDYTKFIKAEAAHQNYLAKHPFGYCNHRIRFKNWPKIVE